MLSNADCARLGKLGRYRPDRHTYSPPAERPRDAFPPHDGRGLKDELSCHPSAHLLGKYSRHPRDAPAEGSYTQFLTTVAGGLIGIQGILTILRDRTTSRGDFIFFVDRLSTYLVEKAMEQLPKKPKTVITPIGTEYEGKALASNVRTFAP